MFHYKWLILIFGLALSPLSLAFGETAEPVATPTPAPPLPTVVKTMGQPVTIAWADGREAQLEVSSTIAERASLAMAISENVCEPSQRVMCEYHSGLSVATYRLAWTKNPDAARIGQTVRFGNSAVTMREDLVAPITWTFVDNTLFPGRHEPALADEISCPSWEWLGQGAKLPTSLTVPAISTEFMLQNPNTQQVENKTIMTATDVVWEKTESDALRIRSLGRFDSYISLGVNAVFIGDVMKWNIEKSTNQYCDIGFKVDIGLLRVRYQGILDRSMNGPFSQVIYDGKARYEPSQLSQVLDLVADMHSARTVYE
jgi:hypothetical protein